MHYIKIDQDNNVIDGPIRAGGIRKRWPNTSFPAKPYPPEPGWVQVNTYLVDGVEDEDHIADNARHEIRDGEWVQVRTVRPLTTEETTSRDEMWAVDYRARRNRDLSESDYTQLADYPNPNKALWATYRQQLRDLPEQAGFPRTVTYPDKPGQLRDEP